MAESFSIYSDEARRVINSVVENVLAARPNLTPDQRRRRPAPSGNPDTLVGQITRVIGTDQPRYDARAIKLPSITVIGQTPFYRNTDSAVQITPSKVGDECELFRDTEGVWRIGSAHEFIATADCQSVAGSRSNIAISIITVTPANDVPITADLILADTTLGNITLTYPEDETGKRIAVTNIGTGSNKVTVTNTVNGISGIDVIFKDDTMDLAYTGVTATGWVIK